MGSDFAAAESLSIDALVLPSAYKRAKTYNRAEKALHLFRENDEVLTQRVREVQQVSLGGGLNGSRSSGPSNPTERVAITRVGRAPDPAEMWEYHRNEAIAHFRLAENHALRALAMIRARGPALQAATEELEREEAERERVASLCSHCGDEPRGSAKVVGRGSSLCVWCHRFKGMHNFLPTDAMLATRRRGGRVMVPTADP